jgi:two-component system KDP operon response regulator KdpE
LVIEDDPAVVHMLTSVLDYGGFTSETVATAEGAIQSIERKAFDAILLDLGLPDANGGELISLIRRQSRVPLIVVSGRETERDKIEALDLGADDYVPKPFLPGELLARIRASIRRHRPPQTFIQIGDLHIYPEQPLAMLGGEEIRLSKAEHALLLALARRPGVTIDRSELAVAIWGVSDSRTINRLHVLVNHLRRKIEPAPETPIYIISQHGVGYRISTG